ncbi:MAG: tetratricopeptide repeat protein [Planctomycetales bacterium]|nr:tetratricopeptide repeat protein [Planctomycetales bacterium]
MKFGPYEVLGELGRGGFGAVFRARHVESGAIAAVKVLEPDESFREEHVRRFQREIAVARTLDHPGIVRVLDVGDAEGRAWFAMELVEGEPLSRVLAAEPMAWRRAAEIAYQVADALAHAHEKGIVHRDVKPGNILVGRKWGDEDVAHRAPGNAQSAFLSDFGLARPVVSLTKLTVSGEALGTPAYMSPEQALGQSESLAAGTDVWSLGCVLHEMLAGRPPFEGENSAAVIGAVLTLPPPDIRGLRPEVPPGLRRILRTALAKQASARYPDGAAFREDLGRLLRGERPHGRPRGALLGFAAGAGLLAAATAWLAWATAPPDRGDRPPERTGSSEDPAGGLLRRAAALRASDPRAAARWLESAVADRPSDRELRREWATSLRDAGEWSRAEAEFGRLLEEDSADPEALFGRGLTRWLARHAGEEDVASPAPDLAAAGASTPGWKGALARGILAWRAKRWDQAEREAAAAGDGWEARLTRALLLHHEGRGGGEEQARAVREFTAALEKAPPLAWIHFERGHARDLCGDHRGAIADYDDALRIRPDYAEALANRGGSRSDLREHAGAIADLDAAVRLRPGSARIRLERAQVRHVAGDLPGALADQDEALRLRPGWTEAHRDRGITREAAGDLSGAREDLEAALRLRPGDARALQLRARLRKKTGDLPGALEDLDEALRARPEFPEALSERGVVRRLLGDPAGARADQDAALRLRPEYAEALYRRGNLRREMKDNRGAIEDYTASLRLAPDDPETLNNRGNARRDSGDAAGAAEDYAAALALKPDLPQPHLGLGILRQGQRDWNGAVAAFESYLRLVPKGAGNADARQRLAACRARIREDADRGR